MSIHEGHRNRLKERFRKEGLDNFDELYVLELLLFYCCPRKDTNPLAHRLLDKFGSLAGVLDANPKDLEAVEGIGPNCTTFFALIKALWRRYEIHKSQTMISLESIEKCGDYLYPYFLGCNIETVYLLCLDAKCKPICCRKVGEGSVNSASISIRKIVEIALNSNASTVVLAHNHPGGMSLPSPEDVQTTHRIYAALEAVEIVLADHIIFSNEEYTSFLQTGRSISGYVGGRRI